MAANCSNSSYISLPEKMRHGEFLVSVQLDPPRTADIAHIKNTVAKLQKAGVKLVDINSSRVTTKKPLPQDSVQLANALTDMGLETIPHITMRDSALSATASQILSSYAWHGVKNFLIITGDPYEQQEALVPSEGIFQKDSVGALGILDDCLRKKSVPPLEIFFAAAVNQNAPDTELEKKRIKEKESAGADFFMSQPIFNSRQADFLFDFYSRCPKRPLMIGVWPLVSPRTIGLIKEGKITGVALPDDVYQESVKFEDNEIELQQWGTERTCELIDYIRSKKLAGGVYIVAPFKNPLLLVESGLLQKVLV